MRWTALGAAIVLLAAACGGDSGDTSGPIADGDDDATATAATDGGGPGEETPTEDDADAEPKYFSDHLEVGTCWNDAFDEEGDFDYSGEPIVVECDEAHNNETYHAFVVDAGPDAPFPDDDRWDEIWEEECEPAFEEFVGSGIDESPLDAFWLGADEDEWPDGARRVVCSLYLPDASLAGSAQGVGTAVLPAGFPGEAPLPEGAVLVRTGNTDDGAPEPPDFVLDALEVLPASDLTLAAMDMAVGHAEARAALEAEAAAGGWEIAETFEGDGNVFFVMRRGEEELAVFVESGDPSGYAFYYAPETQ